MLDQAMTVKPALAHAGYKARGRYAIGALLLTALVGDTLIVFLGLVLASWLRFDTGLARVGVAPGGVRWTDYLYRAAFGTLLYVALIPHRRMYDPHIFLRFRHVLRIILRTSAIWLVAYLALSLLLRLSQEVSRVYVLVAFAMTTGLFIGWRGILSAVARRGSIAQRLRQKILFVGWSEHAGQLGRAIAADSREPYEVAGRVSPAEAFRVLERRDDIDMVILAGADAGAEETMALADRCEREMVEFKVIPTGFEILLSCLQLQTVSGVPVLGISQLPLEAPLSALVKQAMDIAGGIVGLLLSSPIILLFGLMVRLEDPGPIIYRQRRLGRGGRPFWMLKIRSMKVDAEKDGKVGWTVKNDPRRLRVGSFMRKWNIDELPQFWNVLRGEMSLVGPRPERPELIRKFKEEIPHYNARHTIKPGMTGWAQVNGFRGDTDLVQRVRCDLYYMENWSALLDVQIMLMTLAKHGNAC